MPDETSQHRLLTLLTVASLNLGMLERELDQDETSASVRMRVLVARIAQAHRAMIDVLRDPPSDG